MMEGLKISIALQLYQTVLREDTQAIQWPGLTRVSPSGGFVIYLYLDSEENFAFRIM